MSTAHCRTAVSAGLRYEVRISVFIETEVGASAENSIFFFLGGGYNKGHFEGEKNFK
jgi:hypothetical protein